ncbi:MAG: CRISPR-associated endonuclease Cas1 [Promethearchaeota archaeon]
MSKALDPFNTALNYFYYLLEEKITKALAAAGFSKYYPGSGLLHQYQLIYVE